MRPVINKILKPFGYSLQKNKANSDDKDIQTNAEFFEIYEKVKGQTMTSPQRLYALYNSIGYIIENNIEGDFVECGVWKGGSSMAMAFTALKFRSTSKNIFLYDTFEGMSNPSKEDVDIYDNKATQLLRHSRKEKDAIWCYSTLEEVKNNFKNTGYPNEKIHFIKGEVENTIPGIMPEKISLLRLDTDWYESTKHEMKYLFPRLASKGVLIIDDYGHWKGARKAVDEYFEENNLHLLLNRIDYTGRIAIKL